MTIEVHSNQGDICLKKKQLKKRLTKDFVFNSNKKKSAPKLVELKSKQSFSIGKRFKIFCYLEEGSKPYRFEWRKDGQLIPLSTTEHYLIETSKDSSWLTIDTLLYKDMGNYSCSVRNNFGSDVQNTFLSVKGLPFDYVNVSDHCTVLFKLRCVWWVHVCSGGCCVRVPAQSNVIGLVIFLMFHNMFHFRNDFLQPPSSFYLYLITLYSPFKMAFGNFNSFFKKKLLLSVLILGKVFFS